MRARRKGTNDPYTRVEKIQLQDLDILYNADVMEFETHPIEMPDTISTELKTCGQMGLEEHWQNVRERAAIAAMQGVMNFFGSIDYNRETIAKLAVEQADALIEELKKK